MMVVLNSDGLAAYACDTYFERWAAGPCSSSSSSSSSYSSLTQVTLWLCGEFALRRKSDDTEITLGDFDSPIDETKLLGMIDRILTTSGDDKIKSYALTTLAKLYPRCAAASNRELIRKMMKSLDADVNVEIQTRSVEYGKVCGTNDSSISETVFAAVPKLEGMGGGDELDLDLDDDEGARDSLDLTALLSLDDEAVSDERLENLVRDWVATDRSSEASSASRCKARGRSPPPFGTNESQPSSSVPPNSMTRAHSLDTTDRPSIVDREARRRRSTRTRSFACTSRTSSGPLTGRRSSSRRDTRGLAERR